VQGVGCAWVSFDPRRPASERPDERGERGEEEERAARQELVDAEHAQRDPGPCKENVY